MYLANLHGEGLAIYPTHRVVMAQREVDPRFLAAFAVRELPAGTSPAQVESQLDAIDPATVAFALWRGSDRPALIAQVKDTSTVMMAMPAHPRRCAPSTPPCSRRWCWRRCWAWTATSS